LPLCKIAIVKMKNELNSNKVSFVNFFISLSTIFFHLLTYLGVYNILL